MCGRFVMHHPCSLLAQWYDATLNAELPLRYRILPGSAVHALRAVEGHLRLDAMRWGFIPSWAEDPACVPMLHNARGETVAEKPMFRQAFRLRRCLVPASGFFEWQVVPGQKQRRAWYLSLRDGSPMSFAGLWDGFTASDGSNIQTCAIVTTKANALVEPIHARMPVLLARDDWARWLDADTPVADLLALLQPAAVDAMQMWEVDDSTQGDDDALLAPMNGCAARSERATVVL